MQIDIISDNICPWCYIGKKRFERAIMERPDLDISISWRPFQLNPDMPPEGMARREYTDHKFGGEEGAREIYERIRLVGDAEDIPFAFDLVQRTPNTIDSHRLIRWAEGAGIQDAVVEKLFQRYFTEGADIGNPLILCEIAEEVGMDTDNVAHLLDGDQECDNVVEEDASFREMGVTGVPCFIIDKKYVVMGAQEPETFLQLFERIEVEQDKVEHEELDNIG